MNSFQTVGRIVSTDKKRDSVLVTLCFDGAAEPENFEIKASAPAFVGHMRVRLRKGILGRINIELLAKGNVIEVQGFIQGVLHTDKEGNSTLSHELIAVRVVEQALTAKPDAPPVEPPAKAPEKAPAKP